MAKPRAELVESPAIFNAPYRTIGAFFFPLGVRGLLRGKLHLVAHPSDYTLDVIIYGLLVLGVFGFMWIYYDRRDRGFYDAERRKITFHCIRCDHLYTEKIRN